MQQALLRMMEGCTVTVQAKGAVDALGGKCRFARAQMICFSTYFGLGKSEAQYHIDTTNVLFVLSGAFVGLDNIIRNRMAVNRGVGV